MKQFILEVLQILFQYVEEYIIFYRGMFKYDIEVFSQGWIYAWCFVPVFFYFIFFVFKWVVVIDEETRISEPLVMKSAAGYYVGLQYFDEETGLWLPYDRLNDYYSGEEYTKQKLKEFKSY